MTPAGQRDDGGRSRVEQSHRLSVATPLQNAAPSLPQVMAPQTLAVSSAVVVHDALSVPRKRGSVECSGIGASARTILHAERGPVPVGRERDCVTTVYVYRRRRQAEAQSAERKRQNNHSAPEWLSTTKRTRMCPRELANPIQTRGASNPTALFLIRLAAGVGGNDVTRRQTCHGAFTRFFAASRRRSL
jgi:hypothetical protein